MGIQEDIETLETKVMRLKVDYEQYFLRVVKQQPAKLRDEVDRLVLAYHGKQISNISHKFRLNNAVAKYNTYKNYWNRVLRSMEEGTFSRKAEGELGAPVNGASPAAPVEPTAPAAPAEPVSRVEEPVRPEPTMQPHAHTPPPAADDIYSKYIAAKKECNEPTAGITPEALARTVEEYKRKVMAQYNAKDAEVRVAVKDGKAKLIIAPKK